MKLVAPFRVTRAMAVRMLADALMINFALICALAFRFLLDFGIHGRTTLGGYEQEFWSYVFAYVHCGWLLTGICLVVFTVSGFYTYGRAYQGRYKALVILQAVVQSYLIFGFVTYFLWQKLGLVEVPRGALAMAFLLNLTLTLASRMWAPLWRRVVRRGREAPPLPNAHHPRNVLVIGGAGYIGSALLPKLLDEGWHVRVLDVFLYGKEPIQEVLGHPRFQLMEGDFRHVEKVVDAMHGMDAVVHLGAIVGDPACSLDEKVTLKVNLNATQMIAQVAKGSRIRRFIFASTCSVYGAGDEILDERSQLKPVSLYGETKLAAERGLQSMADARFMPTILRFATIYGFSGRIRFDLVVNLLAAKAKVDGQITVYGGSQWRPFVHVHDAALAIFKVLHAPLSLVGNEIFNVGSDEQNYMIREIGQLVQQNVFSAELVLEESASELRNYRVSFEKIRDRLGFHPQWTLEQGIQQIIRTIDNRDVEDYCNPTYHNARFLSESGMMELIRADDDWVLELLVPRGVPRSTRPQQSTSPRPLRPPSPRTS